MNTEFNVCIESKTGKLVAQASSLREVIEIATEYAEQEAINSGDKASEDYARLIAAAPDLLEALKSIVDTHFSLADLTPQHWKIAKAAIAKAEGRE